MSSNFWADMMRREKKSGTDGTGNAAVLTGNGGGNPLQWRDYPEAAQDLREATQDLREAAQDLREARSNLNWVLWDTLCARLDPMMREKALTSFNPELHDLEIAECLDGSHVVQIVPK